MTLVDRLTRSLDRPTGRRGFLKRMTMWGAAIVTAPTVFVLTPTSAYAAVCGCNNQTCDCNSRCCGGYTEFCCTIYGENACPPGGIIGGWWKVDGSSFCGGNARYYMDCHEPCGGCTCGGSGICSGSCNGTECRCANHDCNNRKAGCTHFRYGNCNNQTSCLGPIVCRVVTCTAPWEIDADCSTAVRIDDGTRWHDSPCLRGGVDPRGFVDSVTAVPGEISIRGWALDFDAPESSVGIHTYIDGRFAGGTKADLRRRDVQRAFDMDTDRLGFKDIFQVGPGSHRVCVYAINLGGGRNRLISCTNINVPALNPVGNLEIIDSAESGVRIRGWAFDRSNEGSPVTIRVVAGSQVIANVTADRKRADVQRVFGLSGSRYGFDEVVPARDGSVTYCVSALDIGNDGRPVELGCRTLSLDRDPNGWLDGVDVVSGGVRVTGWAVDPDSDNPVGIHVYADSTFIGGGRADEYRPDVARARGVGDHHGFDLLLPLPGGSRTIRVFAINIGPGRNSLVGSKNL